MSFELQVEFAGLCMWVIHPDRKSVSVLMPDCRKGGGLTAEHPDQTTGVYHVGYMRYNLADAGASLPFEESGEAPRYEGIHRFNFDDLDFGFTDDDMQINIQMPEVSKFAGDSLELLDGVLGSTPPRALLMRTTLRGGAIDSQPATEQWHFSQVLNAKGPPYTGQFAGWATWKRQVDADKITLRLTNWAGHQNATITLSPKGPQPVVKIKIANLCATNPLEWPDLDERTMSGTSDVDFKWLYRLLQPVNGTYAQLLDGNPLPTPELPAYHPAGSIQDCVGMVLAL